MLFFIIELDEERIERDGEFVLRDIEKMRCARENGG